VPYRIAYDQAAREHLRDLSAAQRSRIIDAVSQQLTHQPTVQTANRKQMRSNPIATWELRMGELRVYYEVEDEPEPLVTINAIGVKVRERVRIDGELFEL
jgi:mRNA-degrading endonuclease RelE of RelBE toxin-antitoxin system